MDAHLVVLALLVIKECQQSAQKLALLYSCYIISYKLFLRKLKLDL